MGKSSSAKKVARAARAGGTSKSSDKREIGFPLVIAGVFLVGTAGIFAAKSSQSALAEGVALGEHWHASYEIQACGEVVDGQLDADANAIHHIHAHLDGNGIAPDGLMHIHPQSGEFTRDKGTIGAFFDTVGADLTDDSFELSDGTIFDEEEGCDGEEAVLRVARWDNALATDGEPDAIFDRRLARTRYIQDGETYTIFFGPSDADIPPPSNAASVTNASDIQAPTVLDPSLLNPEGEEVEDGNIVVEDGEVVDADAGSTDDGAAEDDGAADDDGSEPEADAESEADTEE